MPTRISHLKLLLISTSAAIGGGPRHVHDILKGLGDRFSFHVACPQEEPYWDIFSSLVGPERMCRIVSGKFSFGSLTGMKRFVEKHSIKTVHSHGKGAGIYSRGLAIGGGLRVLHTFHGIHYMNHGLLMRNFYLEIERKLSGLTDRFISVSEGEKETACRMFRIPQEKITVIHNGVEPSGLNPSQPEPEKTFTILYLARFSHAKNPLGVLEIAGVLKDRPEVRFLLAGEGELLAQAKNYASRYKLNNVSFLGFNDKPLELMQKSQVLVSTSHWEGLPYSLLDAAAMGLPVVASRVTGNNEAVLHGETGWLYAPGNAQEAAVRIISFADPAVWRNFSSRSMAWAKERFSLSTMLERIAGVYSS
ncbi:MAG: glycosyltransferase [Candidatus Wallbacteria bacterium]|nr:glycosyltransferase [Candidatus Wallbacteria bacterium]